MTDDDKKDRGSERDVGEDAFVQVARDITGPACRSRSGFGSFAHFKQAFRRTVNIVETSVLLAPDASPTDREMAATRSLQSEVMIIFVREALRPRSFFEGLLGRPSAYDPTAFWAFFWALAKAEHDFLTRYTPFWSHEERLTGHLVAVLMERIELFAPHWRALQQRSQGGPTECSVWYADTATARQEATTGADLGLVVNARLPGNEEYFKVLRFQAKKATDRQRAQIEREQLKVLAARPGLGYYLFYHRYDSKRWSLPPTVVPATEIAEQVNHATTTANAKSKTVGVDVGDLGVDFATFVAFGAADPVAECGVSASSAEEAAGILTSSDAPMPSRIVVITLGGGAPRDWDDLFVHPVPDAPVDADEAPVDD